MNSPQPIFASPRRRLPLGFTLIEILLSVFILGIGMIMVASVFPVGANWTRQATEETIGEQIAQNAVTVLQRHYGPGGDLTGYLTSNSSSNTIITAASNAQDPDHSPFEIQALPGFAVDDPTNAALIGKHVPVSERAYQFGASNPFPASDPNSCTYFWTALARLNAAHRFAGGANGIYPGASYKYDIFILVFRKGDPSHVFAPPVGIFEVPDTRNVPPRPSPWDVTVPYLVYVKYDPGTYDDTANPPVVNAFPPIGSIGIGALSGTVFRQAFDVQGLSTGAGIPRPLLKGQAQLPPPKKIDPPTEKIIMAPGPTNGGNNTSSPLIYVYQTTMQF